MTTQVVRVTDDTTRAELEETLAHLCADAKAMRRRGPVGVLSAGYAAQHGRIDVVLGDWEMAPA